MGWNLILIVLLLANSALGQAEDDDFIANRAAQAPMQKDGYRSSESVKLLELHDRVAEYARQEASSSAYLLAAELLVRSGAWVESKRAQAPDPFFAEARSALESDAWAAAALERVRYRKTKGLVGGARTFVMFEGDGPFERLRFRGGESAVVYASPPRGERLRITVFDQNGASVCRTEWQDRGSMCRWTPRWTGAFQVLIETQGNGAGIVRVATN